MRSRNLVPIIYILFLLLPIYWLLAVKTTNEILASACFHSNGRLTTTPPSSPTRPGIGDINSILCVINTVISLFAALPLPMPSPVQVSWRQHLFFWLLTNRIAPAVFACRSSSSIPPSGC